MEPVRIAAFGGTFRQDSLNRHLLNAAVRLAPAGVEAELLSLEDIPPYNQDLDPGMGGQLESPEPVARLRDGIERADGMLIVSPEYNWGVPGYLKNAVDWVSHPPRASVMVGRPVLLMGASTGPAGTGRAQLAWRQILLSTRTPVLTDALQVPLAHTRITRAGALDEALEAEVSRMMALLAEEAALARDLELRVRLRQPSTGPVAGVYPLDPDSELSKGRS
jgi:chromate reductase, NAD(P)H dehydrogenase (quinone)